MDMAPHQHTIIITGCSSGIGECVALNLQKRGWRIFASAQKMAGVAHLAKLGLEALPLDLDDPSGIQQAVDNFLEQTGGTLHALFNKESLIFLIYRLRHIMRHINQTIKLSG